MSNFKDQQPPSISNSAFSATSVDPPATSTPTTTTSPPRSQPFAVLGEMLSGSRVPGFTAAATTHSQHHWSSLPVPSASLASVADQSDFTQTASATTAAFLHQQHQHHLRQYHMMMQHYHQNPQFFAANPMMAQYAAYHPMIAAATSATSASSAAMLPSMFLPPLSQMGQPGVVPPAQAMYFYPAPSHPAAGYFQPMVTGPAYLQQPSSAPTSSTASTTPSSSLSSSSTFSSSSSSFLAPASPSSSSSSAPLASVAQKAKSQSKSTSPPLPSLTKIPAPIIAGPRNPVDSTASPSTPTTPTVKGPFPPLSPATAGPKHDDFRERKQKRGLSVGDSDEKKSDSADDDRLSGSGDESDELLPSDDEDEDYSEGKTKPDSEVGAGGVQRLKFEGQSSSNFIGIGGKGVVRCGKKGKGPDDSQELGEGEKIHMCKIPGCKTRFLRPEHLKRHMRTHTGEKPYPCPVCGKQFTRIDNMKHHQLIHAKSKKNKLLLKKLNSQSTSPAGSLVAGGGRPLTFIANGFLPSTSSAALSSTATATATAATTSASSSPMGLSAMAAEAAAATLMAARQGPGFFQGL